MNNITYTISPTLDEELDEMMVTALVSDGRAGGPYYTTQSYTLGRGFTAEDAIVQFMSWLAYSGKTLHAREYEGV